jgi:hypothetical protein
MQIRYYCQNPSFLLQKALIDNPLTIDWAYNSLHRIWQGERNPEHLAGTIDDSVVLFDRTGLAPTAGRLDASPEAVAQHL